VIAAHAIHVQFGPMLNNNATGPNLGHGDLQQDQVM